MGSTSLYNKDGHAFILLEGFGQGEMVPTNQVVIHDGNEAILLDPGGHKVHYEVINEVSALIPINDLKYLFFSHQDCPEIPMPLQSSWVGSESLHGFDNMYIEYCRDIFAAYRVVLYNW